jgi:hypothetical protein
VLSPPQSNAAAPIHKSPSQNLIAIMTRTTITSLQISASMPFSATDFIKGLKMSHDGNRLQSFAMFPLKPNGQQKTWLRATKSHMSGNRQA